MSLTLDLAKVRYSKFGYIEPIPYYLISTEEVCNAFMSQTTDSGYFFDNYPLLDSTMLNEYNLLVASIRSILSDIIDVASVESVLLNGVDDPPDWVSAYMLGSVISVNSSYRDISYLNSLFGISSDQFDATTQSNCLSESKLWLSKFPDDAHRPPAMFGEPDVIKSLRLRQR